jgi:DNA-binding LytR/AlgR family response regulator
MQEKGKHRLLIAEDDYVVAKNLSLSLKEKGYDVLAIYESGEELLSKIPALKPDLVILDINLTGLMDGIDVAEKIYEKLSLPVLFLTSDRDLATLEKAKLTHPAGYLIKPFDVDELISAIELGIFNHGNQAVTNSDASDEAAMVSESHFFVKSKNRLEKVSLDDILFIEANDIYATLHTRKQSYILSYPLKTLADKFPEDRFMRVHRSYIVNLDCIEAIEDNYLQIGEQNIPVGKTHKAELMRKLSII